MTHPSAVVDLIEMMLEERGESAMSYLRRRRVNKRRGLKEIADAVGVGIVTLSNWERGIEEPSAAQFDRWVKAVREG